MIAATLAADSAPARNAWIDLIRALGAMSVAHFHFNKVPVTLPVAALAEGWHAVWLRGYWGVGVFFALSGYSLFPGWNRATGAGEFLRRRAGRIFPPYWASLLLVAAIALAAKLLTGVNDVAVLPRGPLNIAATLLLLTDPFTSIPTVNWVYWTLTCQIACYLLMGLVLLSPGPARVPVLAGLHLVVCALAIAFPSVVTGPFSFLRQWPVFGCGLALAVHDRYRGAGTVMLLTSLVAAAWLISHNGDPSHMLAGGCATGLVLALGRNVAFPHLLRPLARIGKFSYSLYLVHVPVGVYVLMRFFPKEFASSLSFIASQVILLAGTALVAWLFHLVAERPFLPPAGQPTRP